MTDSARITLDGDQRLAATSRNAADDLDDMSSTGRGVGQMIAARASSNAPKLTGKLAGSIRVTAVTREEIVIASSVDYANIVEFGRPSADVPAQPFMANALRDTQTAAIAAYDRRVEAIANNVKGA